MESSLASLNALEEKINRAAELISTLREEKSRVESENKELNEKLKSLYIENEGLNEEIERLKNAQEGMVRTKQVREEIKSKIEEMLGKMDRLDI